LSLNARIRGKCDLERPGGPLSCSASSGGAAVELATERGLELMELLAVLAPLLRAGTAGGDGLAEQVAQLPIAEPFEQRTGHATDGTTGDLERRGVTSRSRPGTIRLTMSTFLTLLTGGGLAALVARQS
jgi:hypothetical protein